MMKKRIILYGSIGIILIIVGYSLWINRKQIEYGPLCMNNLKQLSIALFVYAEDNQGMLPYLNGRKGIDMALKHIDIKAQELQSCPESRLNYIYYAVASAKDIAHPDKYPLIWEDGFPHHGKKAVVFLDIHTELLDKIEWKKISR